MQWWNSSHAFSAPHMKIIAMMHCTSEIQKMDTRIYFWDNFGNSAPILTTPSLLKAKIYGV